jgi:alanine-alpha-ketoisovalerate/valine-pyruvate aminotransferase
MKFFRIAMIASLTAMTGTVMAATDGTIGATSTGTSIINIGKGNAVQITDVDDIDLGTTGNLAATATQSDSVCVFSSTGGYNITLTSSNGSFILNDANTTTDIAYSIDWTAGGTTTAVYNTAITGLVGDSTSVDCGATTNATFAVSVTAANFNAADPGSYTDTLTLLVQPE